MRYFIKTLVFITVLSSVLHAAGPEIILKNTTNIPDGMLTACIEKIRFRKDISSIELNFFNYTSGSEIYTMGSDGTVIITPGNIRSSCVIVLTEGKKRKIFTEEIEGSTREELVENLCKKIRRRAE